MFFLFLPPLPYEDYEKDVFEQAGITSIPKTMEEFLYDCSLIKEHTEAIPLYTNYNDSWAAEYWEFFPFIEMSGKADYKYNDYIYNPNPFSNNSYHYRVYKFLYDLVSSGYTEPLGTGSYSEGTEGLAKGEAASTVLGSWAFKEIQDIAENPESIGFMPFPNSIDGHQYATIKTDYTYGVSADSKNVEAAKAFVEFMLDESSFAVDTGNISLLKTDPYSDYLQELEDTTMMIEGFPSDEDYALRSSLKQNYTVSNYYTADYYIKDLELKDLTVTPSSSYGTIHIAFGKDVDVSLLALINKCLYAVNNQDLLVALLSYGTPPAKPITLNRLMNSNPVLFIGIISLIFVIITGAILLLFISRDISNKRLSFEMKKYELLGNLMEEYVFEYDFGKGMYKFDSKFQKTFGFEKLISKEMCLKEPAKYKDFMDHLSKIKRDSSEMNNAFQLTLWDGTKNWYKVFTSAIRDKDQELIYIIGKIVNVQKEMEEMQYIQNKADRDGLTKLLNRRGFEKRLPEFHNFSLTSSPKQFEQLETYLTFLFMEHLGIFLLIQHLS